MVPTWPLSPTHGPGRRCVSPGTDALVSSCEGAVLSLYFADCVPVFVAESSGRVVGLAHAGWRGTARGVVGETVRVMCAQFGLAPSEITAVIGPCVGSCCYEVGGDVVEAVVASLPPSADAASVARTAETPDRWLLDLAGVNAAQLRWAGVPDRSIALTGRCTCCEREAFFSVRADGPTTGRCGAFAYIAGSGSEAVSDTSRGA
jgi:YfiH family protein